MIIDVNGKKIAFGLAWKRLVGGGTPEAKAVTKAREVKSALIWTDAEALQVGLLPSSDLTEKEGCCFQRAGVRRQRRSCHVSPVSRGTFCWS